MAKKTAREALQAAYDVSSDELTNWSNPGNGDKINIALGLLSAESSDKTIEASKELSSYISSVGQWISAAIEKESAKMVASNERLAASNEYYARWNKWLALALIAATLFVGLLQAGVLIWQTVHR